MPDNFTAPASGTAFATDEIGGVHYPRTKLAVGADGTAADVSGSNPLPVADPTSAGHLAKLRSYKRWFGITPADANLGTVPDAIYVGGDGNLVIRGDNGVDATFKVFAGQWLEVSPTQVRAATTATGLVGAVVPA